MSVKWSERVIFSSGKSIGCLSLKCDIVLGFEYPAAVHNAGHDMVKGTAFAEQSRGSHGSRMRRERDFGKQNLIDCLSLKPDSPTSPSPHHTTGSRNTTTPSPRRSRTTRKPRSTKPSISKNWYSTLTIIGAISSRRGSAVGRGPIQTGSIRPP